QGRRRGWATGARALHVQVNGALLISAECDVAAILRHCRAHTRLQKVLDCSNDFFVGLVVELAIGIMVETAGAIGCHYRLRRHEVLHDRAEDRRLQMLPVPISLGYGNKVEAEEDADDARNIEKSCCQRRRRAGAIGIPEIRCALFEHDLTRQELQRGGIRCSFSLDEHQSAPQILNSSKIRPSGPHIKTAQATSSRAKHSISSSLRLFGTTVTGIGKVAALPVIEVTRGPEPSFELPAPSTRIAMSWSSSITARICSTILPSRSTSSGSIPMEVRMRVAWASRAACPAANCSSRMICSTASQCWKSPGSTA